MKIEVLLTGVIFYLFWIESFSYLSTYEFTSRNAGM
jgi:hypothetical protein